MLTEDCEYYTKNGVCKYVILFLSPYFYNCECF